MSTGLGDTESINKAFAAGATDFIVKPLNFSILIHRLYFTLRASQNTAELRSKKLQLAAAQRGFVDVRGVHRSHGRAGPDVGVQLINE